MNYIARLIALFVLLSIFLVSGVHGITFGIGSGGADGSSSYSTTIQAEINDQAQGSSTLSDGSLSGSFSGRGGSMPDASYQQTNRYGDHAEVSFQFKNCLGGYSVSYERSPFEASYASASLKLDVNNADKIWAGAHARSRNGFTAGSGVNINGFIYDSGVNINKGSLKGYSASAYADAGRAQSSQKAKSASGTEILFNNLAEDREADPNRTGYISGGSTFLESGKLEGYLGHSSATPSSVSSSQSINYAKGNRIEVATAADYWLGEEGVIIDSTVTGGYIFLYSDESKATPQTSVYPYIPNAAASADIKAFGTIDVQSDAINPTESKSEHPFGKSGKLVATVDCVADSNQVKITSSEWDGLAFMADQSNALGAIGHVGVGFWNDDGTWTIGAVQGSLAGHPIFISNGGWYKPLPNELGLTWPEVAAWLNGDQVPRRSGDGYDQIKIIKVKDSNPNEAYNEIAKFGSRGWGLIDNNCLNAAVDVLQAYGAPVRNPIDPYPSGPELPNSYFKEMPGTVYKWNPDWETYALPETLI